MEDQTKTIHGYKQRRLVAALLLLPLGFVLIWQGLTEQPEEPARSPATATVSNGEGLVPVRLTIPSLTLQIEVVEGKPGEPAVLPELPGRFDAVSWLKTGPKPGEAGTSILAGYAGSGSSLERLSNLKAGDSLRLTANSGQELTFEVTGLQTYSSTPRMPEIGGVSPGEKQLLLLGYEEKRTGNAEAGARWWVAQARLTGGQK